MGTALTRDHVELLRRRVNRLLLAFDSDSAGLAAALRGREFFQEAGLDVWVVSLPEGMDPDNVIRLRGPDSFRSVLEAAAPMVEWELARLLAEADGKGERGEMNALRQAVASLARVPAGVEREYYIRWLAQKVASSQSPDRLKTMETAVREELARQSTREDAAGRRTHQAPTVADRATQPTTGRPATGKLQNWLLAAFLQYGDTAVRYLPMLEVDDFADPEQSAIFQAIASLVERGEPVSPQALLAEVDEKSRGLLAQLALEEVPAERLDSFLEGTVRRIVEIRLRRRQTLLSQRLGEAISEQERQALGQELARVARQRSELAGWRIIGED
jgi:DNA primase